MAFARTACSVAGFLAGNPTTPNKTNIGTFKYVSNVTNNYNYVAPVVQPAATAASWMFSARFIGALLIGAAVVIGGVYVYLKYKSEIDSGIAYMRSLFKTKSASAPEAESMSMTMTKTKKTRKTAIAA
jgi:hypothetical protein